MSQTAYIVTAGSYSDYRIEAVFLDEDTAYAWADNYDKVRGGGHSEAYVEEHEILESSGKIVPALYCRQTFPPDNGDGEQETAVWEGEARPIIYAHSSPLYSSRGVRYERGPHYVWVHGCDFDRVRKAFQDRVAKMKAELEGVA